MRILKSSSQFERINRKTIWYQTRTHKGMGGVFEVKFNNSIIFSKKKLNRFPNDNEVEDLIEYYESVT